MASGMPFPITSPSGTNDRLDNLTTYQSQGEHDWTRTLRVSEILLYVVLGVTIWLFFCMVIYGTQTKRWQRRAGSSSLSSGAIYVVCVAATGLSIPPLAITAVVHWISHYKSHFNACAETEGSVELMYFSSLYLMYFFLWILQRRIYTHPCVKDRVNKCVNIMSICLVPILVTTFIITAALFLKSLGNAFEFSEYWQICVSKPVYQSDAMAIVLSNTVVALVGQVLMVTFTLYPAFRAKFPPVEQDANHPVSSQPPGQTKERYACCKLFYMNAFSSTRLISPIHAHVQRAVRSAILIFVANCVGLVIEIVVIEPDVPPNVHRITGHVVYVVYIFCMLATFPYASRVLTVFWPSCSTIETSRSNYQKREVDEKNDYLEKPGVSAKMEEAV